MKTRSTFFIKFKRDFLNTASLSMKIILKNKNQMHNSATLLYVASRVFLAFFLYCRDQFAQTLST